MFLMKLNVSINNRKGTKTTFIDRKVHRLSHTDTVCLSLKPEQHGSWQKVGVEAAFQWSSQA